MYIFNFKVHIFIVLHKRAKQYRGADYIVIVSKQV